MNKDELIAEIGTRIVQDVLTRETDWTDLVEVVQASTGNLKVIGFVYFANGRHTRDSPFDLAVLRQLLKLREVMAESDGTSRRWLACLIRFNMESSEFQFDFEYDDPGRWAITRDNSEERAKELRPNKMSGS